MIVILIFPYKCYIFIDRKRNHVHLTDFDDSRTRTRVYILEFLCLYVQSPFGLSFLDIYEYILNIFIVMCVELPLKFELSLSTDMIILNARDEMCLYV